MRPHSVARWICFALLCSVCGAQTPAPSSPAFIAAAIRPSDPNRPEDNASLGFNAGGAFQARAISLKQLIEFVHDFNYIDVDQRVVGGPKWLGSAKYDIDAKCDEDTGRSFGKMTKKQQVRTVQNMLQTLLADRFKVRTHHEMRTLAVYALVQAKSGSAKNGSPKNGSMMKASPTAGDAEFGGTNGPPGNWTADDVSMTELASDISGLPEMSGRIVVDKTGLPGRFDFTLKWTPDPTMGASSPGPDSGMKSDPSAPSLLTALQEQLGLKLEMAKEPVDVIVIDSAEMPTPN